MELGLGLELGLEQELGPGPGPGLELGQGEEPDQVQGRQASRSARQAKTETGQECRCGRSAGSSREQRATTGSSKTAGRLPQACFPPSMALELLMALEEEPPLRAGLCSS